MVIRASTADLYMDYRKQLRKIADIKYAAAVLQWDQETYLPELGAQLRGEQIGTLTEVAHEKFTSKEMGKLLNTLSEREDLTLRQKKNVLLSLEDYNKQKKFSAEFVRVLSEATSEAFHSWLHARQHNDFRIFIPALSKVVALKKEEAEIHGYNHHPYNALMNEYEKGATTAMVDDVFSVIRAPLSAMLSELRRKPEPGDAFLKQHFNKSRQWEWSLFMARQLGFNFNAGRQDISEHPFTTNFNSNDVRITTRIDENDFKNMTWSTIHEVGHALYEQGLPLEEYGLPLGEYASLSIHESQSRLWENCVARSFEFWQFYLPKLCELFPEQLNDVNLEAFVAAINKVAPSLIRTEADELTYHFHVIIRYELEKNLISGEIQVNDIPAVWNEQYRTLLDVHVPDDVNGCLQDVHWSHGSFGYFPTYSLGSFYAAQLWEQAAAELPDMYQLMAGEGSTNCLLNWLRQKVHAHGRMFTSEELCMNITGKPLDSGIFINYLRKRLEKIYS